MDAPFSIRKYKFDKVNFSKFFTPSSGLPIAINLIDRKTAVLKARRLLDAHKRFSVGLVKEINKQYKESFSAEKYIEIVSRTYSTLSSRDIFKRAENISIYKESVDVNISNMIFPFPAKVYFEI